jgi:hypothetical protein
MKKIKNCFRLAIILGISSLLVTGEGLDYEYDSQTHELPIPFAGPATVMIKGANSLFD